MSGDVDFTGSLNKLDWEAASANLTAVLSNVPRELELEGVSGKMDITLPSNAGFTLKMEGLSQNFTSEFETAYQNKRYVCGNGSLQDRRGGRQQQRHPPKGNSN